MKLLIQIHKNRPRKIIKFNGEEEMNSYVNSLDIEILTHSGDVDSMLDFLRGYESLTPESLQKIKDFVESDQLVLTLIS
jgi:endo-1,4-beta-mannosidase